MSWLLNLDTVEFFFWLKTNNCFIFSSAPLHETFGRGGALKLPSIFQVGLLFKKKKEEEESKTKEILSREMSYFYSKLQINIHF